MVQIHVEPDCGNAPKKEFLRDFEIAFAKDDLATILDSIDSAVHWEIVGDKLIQGMDEAKTALKDMLDGSIAELTIENIITHGDEGAVSGTMKFADGSLFKFCDIFVFTSHAKDAKIKKLRSFVNAAK